MKCILLCHAFTSCWNNGNAHFLRGVARELGALGHEVVVYEPSGGWSRMNAIRDGGSDTLREVAALFPGMDIRQYDGSLDLDEALDGAALVIVHEWNPPELIEAVGRRRALGAPYTLLFHDTHHRAITAPDELARFDLDGFDGVLAFGEALRQIYLELGWANRAFTWHEAADVRLYHPLPHVARFHDVVWIGNWGDGERGAELNEFLVRPVSELNARARIYGVRYSDAALREIEQAGIEYHGWLPAHRAPAAFAAAHTTVHVPRGPYARSLPGIPTIRMFEAMACGIPVVSAPWDDVGNMFPRNAYLRADNGAQMTRALATLLHDPAFAAETAEIGLRVIQRRHTCGHRVVQLLNIVDEIRSTRPSSQSAQHEGAVA
ncbi:CgeB family protein [Bradyrhizobium cenepequi]|uniref:CgeB family protein n=1 Tax=Bradyrhizobium cenepequi TaxID=2821403 RepID=UPI001CE36F8E|nr:glycosyltransferase [Bradyrhizobium cenepequi]MCA6108652.1 glycosyltransferase [Bradyrhizobium cenepequi]